jgi:hypothetical protein
MRTAGSKQPFQNSILQNNKNTYLHILYTLLCFPSLLFAQSGEVTLTNNQGALTISGQIALQWSHTSAFVNGKKFRGPGTQFPQSHRNQRIDSPFGTNQFDIKSDLMLDYQADRAWSFMQLQFDNQAGIITAPQQKHCNSNKNVLTGSGTADNLFLLKAFTGYALMKKNETRADIEIGRHLFLDIFDSQIQFNNTFDGILFRYNRKSARKGIFALNLAAFAIDTHVNHFGYVGEVDFIATKRQAFDLKYSLISWDRHAPNRYGKRDPLGAQFLNSQATIIYHLGNNTTDLYGAFVQNHKAKKNVHSDNKKAANAFYIGGKIGEIKNQNDWALDANYQWVEAQSVPEWDVSGIGHFNPSSISMYNRRFGGFANYRGYAVTGYYALTKNITFQLILQRAKQLSKSIGGTFHSTNLQVSTIYSF